VKTFISIILLLGLSTNTLADNLWQEGEDFFQQGDMLQAIQTWEFALKTTPPTRSEHIDALIHLAIAYQTQANYVQAKTILQHIVTLLEKNIGTQEQKVIVYSHLGDVLLALQDPVRAKVQLDKALELSKTISDPSILGHLYNNRCNLLSVEEFTEEASATCDKAIEFAQQHHDPSLYLQALTNQVHHLLHQDDLPASITTLKLALSQVRQQSDSYSKVFHLLSLGQLALTIEKKYPFQKIALDIYQILDEALQLTKQYKDKRLISYANGYLGQLYEQRKHYQEAMQLTRQAIFFSQDLPELLYLWEWQRGRILHAQKDLKGAITAHQQAIDHLRPIYSHLVKGQRDSRTAFQERIRAVYFSFADVLLKQAKQVSSEEEKAQLINQARNILEEMKKAEMENYFQDECVTASHESETSVEDLEQHTVVLHPVLLPDRTEILYNLPDGVHQIVIPIEADTIQKTATKFRENLQSIVHYRFLTQAAELYNWLIKPLKEDLRKHEINTLVIVPDGALRTIPFAALFDQEEKVFLVQQFAVAVAHSLNLTEPRPLPRENLSILLEGLSEGVQNFSPLPYVPHEIDAIAHLFTHKAVFLDQDFSLANTQKALQTVNHNIVHIASHGQFDRDPNKTFILTYDGKLTMDRLEQLLTLTRHREEAVELLTLSACQTAVGDERAALGLAGVAIKAGARSALASLWFINDESTAQLVGEFYKQLQNPALSKAQALQKAQLKLITSAHFRHPAYWAPFLLIGNWL
jgi:CHAT domain-containing protein/Tfp pilus assembly protein PilF